MPVIFFRKKGDDTSFCIWKITETEEQLWQGLRLSDQDKNEIQLLKLPKRRLERLACRKGLSFLLESPEVPVSYGNYGEPLLDSGKKFHISFSHSGEYAAAALSRKGKIGIDIERITPRILELHPRFIRPDEARTANSNNPEEVTFFWCAKEAIYKLFPEYKADFLNDIFIEEYKEKGCISQKNSLRATANLENRIWENLLMVVATVF